VTHLHAQHRPSLDLTETDAGISGLSPEDPVKMIALAMMLVGTANADAPGVHSVAWDASRGIDPMTDKVNASLETKSTDGYQGFLGVNIRPTLSIFCQYSDGAYSTWLMISPINPKTNYRTYTQSVRYRIDDNKPVTDTWSEGNRGREKALLLKGKRAIELAKKLRGAERLLFAWPEALSADQTVTFDVSGLGERLAIVAEPCGWKFPPEATPKPTSDPRCWYSADGVTKCPK
jgi:hypothetical protein